MAGVSFGPLIVGRSPDHPHDVRNMTGHGGRQAGNAGPPPSWPEPQPCAQDQSAGGIAPTIDDHLADLRRRHARSTAQALLEAMIRHEFRGRIAAVSSFGVESAITLSMVADVDPGTPVIFLDTGKHFAETLAYRDLLIARIGLTSVRSVTPGDDDLERADPDGRLHRQDADLCCRIRKVVPLECALAGYGAWITGRKRYHGGERAGLEMLEAVDSRIKVNPLAGWTPAEVAAEFRRRGLPVHPLVATGYRSIGCAPCTSRVTSERPARSGRWAGSGKTECGIHRARRTAI